MWVDPHVVEVVLAGGLPLTFVGWHISRRFAVIDEGTEADGTRCSGPPSPGSAWTSRRPSPCSATTIRSSPVDLPDPIAMAIAYPSRHNRAHARHLHCAVETESPLTEGTGGD